MAAYKARMSPTAAHRVAVRLSGPVIDSSAPTLADDAPALTLLTITDDAREAVLSHLNAAELCQCQLVCRSLRDAARGDSLWRRLCQRAWVDTDVQAWLAPSSPGGSASSGAGGCGAGGSNAGSSGAGAESAFRGRDDASRGGGDGGGAAFSSYRQLYPALLQHQDLIGLWRLAAGSTQAIYSFRWTAGCVRGTKLTYMYSAGGSCPQASAFVDVCGDGGAKITELTDQACTLEKAAPLGPLHRSPSQGAQAAAAVAANRVPIYDPCSPMFT